jgi:hypothetical protein
MGECNKMPKRKLEKRAWAAIHFAQLPEETVQAVAHDLSDRHDLVSFPLLAQCL